MEPKIKKAIINVNRLQETVGKLLLEIDDNKAAIMKYFDEKGLKSLEVSVGENNDEVITAKKTERATITYDVEKLRQKLDKEVFNEATTREYIIKDINGLVALLKANGVSAKEFKSFVDTKVKVNNDVMKQLYDSKEVTLSDIKGCYTAKISKSVTIKST